MHCSRDGHDRVEMQLLDEDRVSGTLTYRCPKCGWEENQYGRPDIALKEPDAVASNDRNEGAAVPSRGRNPAIAAIRSVGVVAVVSAIIVAVVWLARAGSDSCSDPAHCYRLGKNYVNSIGVAQDLARAASYYERGCDGGHAGACAELGFMCYSGEGVAQDYLQAAARYQQGCNGGDAFSCAQLGRMYADGIGVPQNTKRAAALYEVACSSGFDSSEVCR